MNKVWSQGEKLFIQQNAGVMKDVDIAVRLTQLTGRNVSLQAVRKQRQKLGITKKPGRGICALKQEKISHAADKVAAGVGPQGVQPNPSP